MYELSPSIIVRRTLLWQLVGFTLLAFHMLLAGQSAAFYLVIVVLQGWLFFNSPLAGIIVYFQILIYQNLMLALFSNLVDEPLFASLQGTSFVILGTMAAISLYRLLVPRWMHDQHVMKILRPTLLALVLATIYAAYGAISEGFKPAMIYYREITSVLLSVLVGLDVGRLWGYKTIGNCFLFSTIISLALACCEIINPIMYYDVINAAHFFNTKLGLEPSAMFPHGLWLYSSQDLVAQNTQPFFNITAYSGPLKSIRFDGTMMHIIAYGYVLSIIGLVAISVRKSFWLLLIIPLLAYIGVKGAVLLLSCTVLLWFIWLLSKRPKFLFSSAVMLMVLYIGSGIYLGIQNEDFHVIGFMGGVKGFIHNPFGHGLGAGGNESAEVLTGAVSWTGRHGFQQQGADFALESAIGVLLYQMGFAALSVLAVFYMILRCSPFAVRDYRPRREHLIMIAAAVVAVNAVFQEEAFSPNAGGLLTLLSGVLITNQNRAVQVVNKAVRQFRVPSMSTALTVFLFLIHSASAAVPPERLVTLESGVNLTTVFPDDYRPLQPMSDLLNDIKDIRQDRFNHIRIMVSPFITQQSEANLFRLDAAVKAAVDQHLGVILCLNAPHFGQLVDTNAKNLLLWTDAWQFLSHRYARLSEALIFFELANEPRVRNGWPALQEQLRNTVRQNAPENTIILTGSPNSTPQAIVKLPLSADDNVVYSFHLYKPMVFTHQGAEWAKPQYAQIGGLPYPPPQSLNTHSYDPALQTELEAYKSSGDKSILSEIALVSNWARANDVNVIATEYGVFRKAAPAQSRDAWLIEAHHTMQKSQIGSTVWEYRGGFGIKPDLDQGCQNPLAIEFHACD